MQRLIIWGMFQLLFLQAAQAMPMFARKYQVQCDTCHAAVPRLNFTGFKFKAAGYRMPWEISHDQDDAKLKLENYVAFVSVLNAPLQIQVDHSTGQSSTSLITNGNEIDVHPMTGSFGKYWGSGFELDGLTTGSVQLNQAFLTFTAGSADSFGTLQAGVVPNFLGYGILDRPAALSTPLVLSTSANNPALNTLFTWTGVPRGAGLTGSWWLGDGYFSASVRNRLVNGANGLDSLGNSNNHMGDIEISATEFYDHVGASSAVSLFYYKGLSQIPTTVGGTAVYGNSFNHLGLAVNKYFSDQANLFAGGGWNVDQEYDPATGNPDLSLHSFGTFGGFEWFWSPLVMAGARFDQFRTDINTPNTQTLGGAAYVYWHVINWVILAGEYQYIHYGSNTSVPVGVNGGLGSVDQHIVTAQATVTF